MYERIFDISKMIAKIDIMIFCNIAPHSRVEACLFDRFVLFGEQRIFGTIRQLEFSICHLHLISTLRNISRYSGTQVEACLFDRFVLFGEQRNFLSDNSYLISESDPLQVCRFSRFVLFGEWKMLFTTRQVEFRFVRFDEWKILCSI